MRMFEVSTSRTWLSKMSSRRLWAPGMSRTDSKNFSGSTIRQRAVVSTSMNFLSFVGTSLLEPSQRM